MKNEYQLKELKKEIRDETDFGEQKEIDEVVGKEIKVIASKAMEGQYGTFYIMDFILNKKEYSISTGSKAIIKFLELGKFPFTATIIKGTSKKYKGKPYYAFK